jgi:DNA polymerase/3'-5' exonuclease PolX
MESGEVENVFGSRTTQHIRQGLTETHAMLLYRADDLRELIEEFLLSACHVSRAEAAGDYRRRVEVIEELVFVVGTDDFPNVIERMQRYGGRTPLAKGCCETPEFWKLVV